MIEAVIRPMPFSDGGDARTRGVGELVVPVHCDSFESLSLTLTPDVAGQLLAVMFAQPALDVMKVEIQFRLNYSMAGHQGVLGSVEKLSDKTVDFYFYKDLPTITKPLACKRGVAKTFLIGNLPASDLNKLSGYALNCSDATIVLHIPLLPTEEATPALATREVEIMIPKDRKSILPLTIEGEEPSFALQMQLEPLQDYLLSPSAGLQNPSPEHVLEIAKRVECFYLSVSLDGRSTPRRDLWGTVYLYDDITNYSIHPPVAKGGAVHGATITLQLNGEMPLAMTASTESGHCLVRLRGHKEGAHLDVHAALTRQEVQEPKDSKEKGPPKVAVKSVVAFALPESTEIASLEPIVSGKEKLLFVDISLDGGESFEAAVEAKLQVK
jgi:hypothetical protein